MKDEKTARLFQTAEGHWHWVPASWDVNIPMGLVGHEAKSAALRAAAGEGMEWFLISYAWPPVPVRRIPRKYRTEAERSRQ